MCYSLIQHEIFYIQCNSFYVYCMFRSMLRQSAGTIIQKCLHKEKQQVNVEHL